ncbi:hypothetical protein AAG602_02990 [Citromicrobium bathyomarinum]
MDENDWKVTDAIKYLQSAESGAPGVVRELLGDDRAEEALYQLPSGLLVPVVRTEAGPISQKLLAVWSLKLSMALFAEHVGKPLPLTGGAFGMWFLNAGLAQETAEGFLKILPIAATLSQGKKTSSGQFDYRYNSDGKSIVAALAHFHNNIHFFVLAFEDPEKYGFPKNGLSHGIFARPGELIDLMPPKTPLHVYRNPSGAFKP